MVTWALNHPTVDQRQRCRNRAHVIALLTHAAPPRTQAALAAELDTMLSSTTDLAKLTAARKRLLDLGAASSSLATTTETPSGASAFSIQRQQSPPAPTPAETTSPPTATVLSMHAAAPASVPLAMAMLASPTRKHRRGKPQEQMIMFDSCSGASFGCASGSLHSAAKR